MKVRRVRHRNIDMKTIEQNECETGRDLERYTETAATEQGRHINHSKRDSAPSLAASRVQKSVFPSLHCATRRVRRFGKPIHMKHLLHALPRRRTCVSRGNGAQNQRVKRTRRPRGCMTRLPIPPLGLSWRHSLPPIPQPSPRSLHPSSWIYIPLTPPGPADLVDFL